MSLEFYLKMRDGLQQIADACNEELEKHAPTAIKLENNNPEEIAWTKTSGQKGEYQRYPAYQQLPTDTPAYTALLNSIKSNNGKYMHGGLFYWLFEDGITIGRKPAKKR